MGGEREGERPQVGCQLAATAAGMRQQPKLAERSTAEWWACCTN